MPNTKDTSPKDETYVDPLAEPSEEIILEEMAKHGIRRETVDHFYFGEFSYTNLRDAVAQAKRESPR